MRNGRKIKETDGEGQEMRKGKHQDVSSVGKMWEYKEKERKGLNSGRDKRKTKEGKRHRS